MLEEASEYGLTQWKLFNVCYVVYNYGIFAFLLPASFIMWARFVPLESATCSVRLQVNMANPLASTDHTLNFPRALACRTSNGLCYTCAVLGEALGQAW